MIQLSISIHIRIYVLFCIIFHYRLLQDTEYSSLCYTVGPCWLSIVYIVLYTCKCFSDECENQKTHNELQGCYQLSRMESSFDFVAHVGGIKFMRGMVKTITHKQFCHILLFTNNAFLVIYKVLQ